MDICFLNKDKFDSLVVWGKDRTADKELKMINELIYSLEFVDSVEVDGYVNYRKDFHLSDIMYSQETLDNYRQDVINTLKEVKKTMSISSELYNKIFKSYVYFKSSVYEKSLWFLNFGDFVGIPLKQKLCEWMLSKREQNSTNILLSDDCVNTGDVLEFWGAKSDVSDFSMYLISKDQVQIYLAKSSLSKKIKEDSFAFFYQVLSEFLTSNSYFIIYEYD